MFDFTNRSWSSPCQRQPGSAVAPVPGGGRLALVDHDDEGLRAAFADLAAAPEHLLLGGVDLTD